MLIPVSPTCFEDWRLPGRAEDDGAHGALHASQLLLSLPKVTRGVRMRTPFPSSSTCYFQSHCLLQSSESEALQRPSSPFYPMDSPVPALLVWKGRQPAAIPLHLGLLTCWQALSSVLESPGKCGKRLHADSSLGVQILIAQRGSSHWPPPALSRGPECDHTRSQSHFPVVPSKGHFLPAQEGCVSTLTSGCCCFKSPRRPSPCCLSLWRRQCLPGPKPSGGVLQLCHSVNLGGGLLLMK